MDIKQLSSKVVYENRWMRVKEDEIGRADGSKGIYGVVEKPDFVIILPVEGDSIHLVEQYRYPVKARFWELPQGSWETNEEASPEEIAKGELFEETGLVAHQIDYLGFEYLAYGYSNQKYHIFYATDLEQQQARLELEEQDLICKKVLIAEFEEMILEGTIRDATSICAYSLAKMKGYFS